MTRTIPRRQLVDNMMPLTLRAKPRDERGYPIPWFTPIIDGKPDFRAVLEGKAEEAVRRQCCWICGHGLRRPCAFVVGPMCAVNRVSAEPPSHVECAIYAAKVCPFLSHPKAKRAPKPANAIEPPGVMIERNPGVTCVWITKAPSYSPDIQLFGLGEPERVRWYCQSRKATRAEVMVSIGSGMPTLLEAAELDGEEAIAELESQLQVALELIPAEGVAA